jgi:hypothetical protein
MTTFWLYPGCRRRIRWSLMKPKQARDSKDLKGLKCRYTLRIRAQFLGRLLAVNQLRHHGHALFSVTFPPGTDPLGPIGLGIPRSIQDL